MGDASALAIGPDTTMEAILGAYPSAKIGLFQRYHIGGCSACAYQLTDTLAEVCKTHGINDPLEAVIDCIRRSDEVELALHIRPAEVAAAINRRAGWRFLDARTEEEYAAGHLAGAQLITPQLTFEALDEWPKDAAVVVYSNHGRRSLDRASHLRAYGLTNAKSMDGGLSAWSPKFPSLGR